MQRSSAEKKSARKKYKIQKAGKLKPDEQWHAERVQAAVAKREKTLRHASGLRMPEPLKLTNLESSDPELYERLLSGKAVVKKESPLDINRAIWYNEVDSKHTFNVDFQNCRANFSLVKQAEEQSRLHEVPQVMKLYVAACEEYEDNQGAMFINQVSFADCEAFLKYWQEESETDIEVFSKKEIKELSEYTNGICAAIDAMESLSLGKEGSSSVAGVEERMQDKEGDVATQDGVTVPVLRRDKSAVTAPKKPAPPWKTATFSEWVMRTFESMNKKMEDLQNS